MQLRTVQLRIVGRVQGVGFREAMSLEAGKLGVTGWVRNRTDGSVEALAQGSAEQVEALCDWARRGPPAARVERVERVQPVEAQPRAYARFERWPTA